VLINISDQWTRVRVQSGDPSTQGESARFGGVVFFDPGFGIFFGVCSDWGTAGRPDGTVDRGLQLVRVGGQGRGWARRVGQDLFDDKARAVYDLPPSAFKIINTQMLVSQGGV